MSDVETMLHFWRAVYTVFTPTGAIEFSFDPASIPDAVPHAVTLETLRWAIVTAWNPGGKPAPLSDNHRREHDLVDEVRRAGLTHYSSENRSPAGDWREPGVAILNLSRERSLELARRYGQHAVIYANGHDVGILDTRTERWTVRRTFVRSV